MKTKKVSREGVVNLFQFLCFLSSSIPKLDGVNHISGLIPFRVAKRDDMRRSQGMQRGLIVYIHTSHKRCVDAWVRCEDVNMDGILVTDPGDDEIGTIDSVPIGYS